MRNWLDRYKIATITTIITLLIALIPLVMHMTKTVILISNIYFMAGLFLLVVAAFIMVLGGHLFTGWRRFHRRGDDADTPGEKVPARKVGRLKNEPIRVSKHANRCFQVAIPLIIISILITIA